MGTIDPFDDPEVLAFLALNLPPKRRPRALPVPVEVAPKMKRVVPDM